MRKYFSLILSIMLVISLVPQNTMAQQTNNVITKENTKISVYENNSDASIAQSDNSETNENLVYVTGDIVSDDGSNVVTWTKDKTYVVCSKNIVELPYVKCKLVIEPGTTVLFGTGTGNVNGVENSDVVYRPYSIFRVEEGGSIEAKGTQDEPIVFKNIDTHAGWNGIEITLPDNGEVTDTFEYCYFINGGAQFRDFTEGLIDVSHGTKNTKFNLTVDHCIFDSTELVSKNILQPSEIGAGFFYGDYDANTVESNIKISNSMFKSLSMGIEGYTKDLAYEYFYNDKSKCKIENNTFKNNIPGSYNPSVNWGGNAEIINNEFYTTEGGALTKNALNLDGQCDFVIEGNVFHGSQSNESSEMNKCAPIRVQFGANVNADKTRTYANNTCDYSAVFGKYVELSGSMITPECTLGEIDGLEYYFKNCTIGYNNGNDAKVILTSEHPYVIASLDIMYNGELIAKGTKENPIKFVGASDRGLTNASNQISITQNSSSDYLNGKAVFENCEFDNVKMQANIISKKTGYEGKIPQILTVKDCKFTNESSGMYVTLNSYNDYIYGKISVENTIFEGKNNDSFTGLSISAYGTKVPKDNIFKISNCIIHNFNKQNDGIGLSLSVEEDLIEKIVLENVTIANCYYGVSIGRYMTKLPIIKNCIIAGNKRGFKNLNDDTDTSNITYTCIYNDSWNGNTYNYGIGCIFEEPLFANIEKGNYHLKSKGGRWNGTMWIADDVTSPCINAGDPLSDYSNEPAPNGSRVNMGAYGNTAEASKTDDGTFIPTECEHKNTTIINKKDATEQEEGYTGDTYCNDCDKIIAIGKTLPRIIASTSETTKEADSTQTTKKADVTNPTTQKQPESKTETTTNPQNTTAVVSPPKTTKISKTIAKKKSITLKWKAVKNVKGYEIQVATDKKFKKNKKTISVNKQKANSYIVKKLKAKKTYNVRIRTYKIVDGNKVYSAWSKTKRVKTK